MKEATFSIHYPYGMHARPATVLVAKANTFKSRITLTYRGNAVNMKSIMGVMSQGIPAKTPFKVAAEGVDEEAAILAIAGAIEDINSNL
ncbi:MAG TPA: phosphocarrier protein HPr [Acholeplasmatales bacterium]|nr:MAG: hypothetical protein A2Y16_04245 [Tenericutes bacterium GWF2_57_13]HAQ57234.1 phosphocarrier protein HPr [Acholeplasmatales bacterium]